MRFLRLFLFFLLCLTALVMPQVILAQCSSQSECEAQIADLQSKIASVQKESKTLSSAISYLNLKQALTQRQIDATAFQIQLLQRDIESLSGKITLLQGSLDSMTKALLKNIVASYETRNIDEFQAVLGAKNFSDAISSYRYLNIARQYRQDLLFKTTQTKMEYDQEKSAKEKKQLEIAQLKKTYEKQKQDLIQQQQTKQQLLTQTKNSEANYQKLLADAQAQLAGFLNFTSGQTLLTNQTSCDDWGCYYNQRDVAWGNIPLNNTQYSIARAGCLLTSMAMVLTHYGYRSVTPISINSNPNNFAPTIPSYLNLTIFVDGVTAQRVSATIDPILSTGNPVVVGMRFSNGGTHFIVLKSGSGGNYLMRDPDIANGKDINFKDHYSIGSIYEIHKVIVN